MNATALRLHGAGDLRLEPVALAPAGEDAVLVYTHLSLPMTPIADFARLGETDPLFADLARVCEANRGLWNREAEDLLLARAPRLPGLA